MDPDRLYELMSSQRRHDEYYHRDVYFLPPYLRMHHLVLHFSKYAGRLYEREIQSLKDSELIRTLTDTFIIALSASELFQISPAFVSQEMQYDKMFPLSFSRSIESHSNTDNTVEIFRGNLVILTGRMAKGCESLDHLEGFNYRMVFSESIQAIILLCLLMASLMEQDIAGLVEKRWLEIENARVL